MENAGRLPQLQRQVNEWFNDLPLALPQGEWSAVVLLRETDDEETVSWRKDSVEEDYLSTGPWLSSTRHDDLRPAPAERYGGWTRYHRIWRPQPRSC